MIRVLAVLVSLAAISFAPAAPVPTHLFPRGQSLTFPTSVGTTWTYEGTDGKQTIIVSAVEEKDGAKIVTTETMSENGKRTPHTVQRISAAGVFLVSELGNAYDEPWCMLRLPYREGQTWETVPKRDGPLAVGMMKTGPMEKIKTPAGEFTAGRVDWEFSIRGGETETIKATYWYADGVGLVKIGDNMNLKSYTLGK